MSFIYKKLLEFASSYINPKETNSEFKNEVNKDEKEEIVLATKIDAKTRQNKTNFINESINDLEQQIKDLKIKQKDELHQNYTQNKLETLRNRSKLALLSISQRKALEKSKKSENLQKLKTVSKKNDNVNVFMESICLNNRPEEEERLSFKLRPVGVEEENFLGEIFAALSQKGSGEIFSKFGKFSISIHNAMTLLPGRWLNDEVINFYMAMLQRREDKRFEKRFLFFNTFFYTMLSGADFSFQYEYSRVRRWTSRLKIDIFSCEKIFIPINIRNCHWTLAVIDVSLKAIFYLDSYLNPLENVFEHLQNYIFDEYNDKKQTLTPQKKKEMEFKRIRVQEIPVQTNSYDCGVFVCKAAEFIADGMALNYSQEDMPLLRKRMLLEILRLKTDSELFYQG